MAIHNKFARRHASERRPCPFERPLHGRRLHVSIHDSSDAGKIGEKYLSGCFLPNLRDRTLEWAPHIDAREIFYIELRLELS